MDNIKFGMYLSKIRVESGFKSQRKLADVSGVSSATISRIESGIQKPQPETLKALAPYLRAVSYEELMEAAGYLKSDKYFISKANMEEIKDAMKEKDVMAFELWELLYMREYEYDVFIKGDVYVSEEQADTIESTLGIPKEKFKKSSIDTFSVDNKLSFNPIDEINKIIKQKGLENGASGFFDIEKWKQLGPDEIKALKKYFDWMVEQAEKDYNPDENDTDGL